MNKSKVSPSRVLKSDEKILWNLVTRTVSPLNDQRLSNTESEPTFPQLMGELKGTKLVQDPALRRETTNRPLKLAARHSTIQSTKKTSGPQPITAHIDKPVYRKIAKGRLPIDGEVDLHNLTQDQAVGRLHAFLYQAQSRGYRHVLVITGKGGSPTSEGVLRRMLPIWLNAPPFSSLVNGYQVASRSHGGEGAFYVRLRRLKA